MILMVALIITSSLYLCTLPTLFKIPTANTTSIVRARPNIPEYSQMEDHILQAINQVYSGADQPEEALDEAAGQICEGP